MPEYAPIKESEFIDEYISDYPKYAKDFLFVRSPDQMMVKMDLNAAQQTCHEILEKQAKDRGYVRALILKARRLGMSTYVEGRFYHRASMRPLQNVYIVSHRDDSCNVLFNMTKLMQEKNPLAPGTFASNRKELKFKATRSEYAFSSADSPEAAKSRDITLFHGSEVAEWRAADDLLGALLPCLPKPPTYSEALLESTAQGYGNSFQKMVFKAYAEGAHPFYTKNGFTYAYENPGYDWILIFFPWFVHSRNSIPFRSAEQREGLKLDLEKRVFRKDLGQWGPKLEYDLMQKWGITLEQMNWREWTIRNDCNDNLNKFHQEHPATVHEAFISTGGNIFSAELCNELEVNCRPPVHVGKLIERSGRVVCQSMANGPLSIWELPYDNRDYLVSIDPAGGMRELQADKNEADFTCMDVWKREDRYLVQVAQWYGQPDYDLIGDESILLARMYGWAAIAVLRMNHGLAVLTVLRRESWPRVVNDEDGKPGIMEDRKRKPAMVDDLLRASRDGEIHFVQTATIQEMRTYIERDRKMAAEDGCKDDRVSSAYCGVYAQRRLPRPQPIRMKDYAFHQQKKLSSQEGVIEIASANRRPRQSTSWSVEVDD